LVEFTDGSVEVLPMPTWEHQKIVLWLAGALMAFVGPRKLGEAVCAPIPTKLRKGKWREPDIVFVLNEHLPKDGYPDRADLAVEVVSADTKSRERDYKKKRLDYAAAGIAEYWIVDPRQEQITVLTLDGKRYAEHGVFKHGARATSVLLKGFAVEVADVFKAGK
jgi:Uma2 family endonuclease